MNTSHLNRLEFELAYLALLTKEGVKPVSRWEKCFDGTTEETLNRFGLKTRAVERTVESGAPRRELLFSTNEHALESYAARFDHTPVNNSPETMRLQGRLFGYPTCCVESYVTRGYVPNSLRWRDQRILFHWACPRCSATPALLPQYRQIYLATRTARRQLRRQRLLAANGAKEARCLRRAAVLAACIAALGFWPTTRACADPLDPHVITLPIAADPDQDCLATAEETVLNMAPDVPDEDNNGTPDGLDLVRLVASEIARLPSTPSSNQVYRIDHPAFGLEQCSICGTNINMGFVNICNPRAELSLSIPYVALHYLEHDSFSFAGSIHQGRADACRLLDVLFRPELNIAADETNVTLRWPGKAGRIYQVFIAPDIAGPWSPGPIFVGNGTELVFSDSKVADGPGRFYKVIVR